MNNFRIGLSKNNLLCAFLMQQATFLNTNVFQSLKHLDFSLVETRSQHESMTKFLLQKWGSSNVGEFSYTYDTSIWEPNRNGLSKVYRIQVIPNIAYDLWIDLDKSPFEAAKIRIQHNQVVSEFTRVNLFDTQFVEGV